MNDRPSDREPPPSWTREDGGAGDSTVEENWLFRLRRERYVSRTSGKAHAFYVMHLADAVNVIAVTPRNEVVLVRQFRAGSGRDSLEPPGGLLEPGEDPREAGARELREETGYAGGPAVLLGSAWSNPSLMTSRIHTVFVADARRVDEPRLDSGEEVMVSLVPAVSVPNLIKDGQIDHALSVLGLLWWLAARFPGPLARGGPAPRWTILRVMVLIAYCGLVAGACVGVMEGDAFAVLALPILLASLALTPKIRMILKQVWRLNFPGAAVASRVAPAGQDGSVATNPTRGNA